ncbi:hypothetical protein [Roseovarius sp. M141]|uniref:hypothetical protein n=1 Tax=Roseovarius sp. M141 TaxID=2583806 RepID=UPI0020CDAC0F|nr:hypothetical protein [Roseovarius sp. M141]MCQ0093715.1 hypothetical protein [Roseovarius sp. M141]
MFAATDYKSLNHRQKENYNFQKIAARLADYGFNSMRLSDDFHGADFIALHVDGETLLRVQLKGRLTFHQKYYGKSLHIAFRDRERVFVYPHDLLRQEIEAAGIVERSTSKAWVDHGSRSWRAVPKHLMKLGVVDVHLV